MSDIDTAAITYGRRTAKMVFAYPVIVSTLEEERRVREWLMSDPLNWRLLNIADHPDGKRWILNFTYTELVADTDRGDLVSYDRRWEVKE